MARQFGKVDISATWLACGACPHRHLPGSPCPPSNVWLVLAFCGRCSPKTGAYCSRHGGHRGEPGDAHHRPAEPVTDVPATRGG